VIMGEHAPIDPEVLNPPRVLKSQRFVQEPEQR
jgi:hypothetical protein